MRHLNKIQKLIWFKMATEIDVGCICYSNKFFNLTVYDIRNSKSFVLLCTSHATQKYF